MKIKAEVGDNIRFKKFSYTNKLGGTSSANRRPITDYDIFFDAIVSGVVVHEFEDIETGQTIHVKLDDEDWNFIKDKTKENLVYVSEFDVSSINSLTHI